MMLRMVNRGHRAKIFCVAILLTCSCEYKRIATSAYIDFYLALLIIPQLYSKVEYSIHPGYLKLLDSLDECCPLTRPCIACYAQIVSRYSLLVGSKEDPGSII